VQVDAVRILLVSTVDVGGGAAGVAWNLLEGYRRRGEQVWLATGLKRSEDADVLLIPEDGAGNVWARACTSAGHVLSPLAGRAPGVDWLRRTLQIPLAHPRRWVETRQGKEDFHFPGTWRLLDLAPERPDIVHCHNLHSGYFDLRALPWLSSQVPVVLTLHDTWLLSGHCAYSLGCDRWVQGCGHCPRLDIYPALLHDGTAFNWQRKQEIYARSRLYLATPSAWLMGEVERSMLFPAIAESRIIPYGLDLTIFHPADRRVAREALDIPQDVRVLLFAANRFQHSPFKDYPTIRAAVSRVVSQLPEQDLLFIALGDDGTVERIGRAEIRYVPYQSNPNVVAAYYQSADLFLHAAHADTFPNTVLEALACGTPVVATAVGGIPEQVKGLADGRVHAPSETWSNHGPDAATGVLVPHADAELMASAIVTLLTDESLRRRLGENAAQDARQRFDLERQVADYLRWYGEILERRTAKRAPSATMHSSSNTEAPVSAVE
jgi:glycosyltransferase involved in cell wall biosynthesis